MKYYKIIYGYNEGDYVPITENELAKAIALFMEGTGRGVFNGNAIRGQDIMRVVEDWHADQKWNRGWKMQPEDYQSIKHLEKPYKETYESAKYIAEVAIKENKRELLEQPLQKVIGLYPKPQNEITDGIKQLAEKFTLK